MMRESARPRLTPAQWLVLARLAAGDTNAAIARSLGIALPTVASHLTAIYQRLPHANRGGKRAAAVAWYLREGQAYHEEGR
ncbi:MAG TPA: LuxR C-terminal-related transcriptional regulator [Thermomicrobiales bacterium]|jgi:DNA-binding NarL/FixJ family response regulator